MSTFTTSARRIGAVAVVLLALVPAASATVPHESGRADGGVAALPEPLRVDRPSGPLAPGAPGAPGAVRAADTANRMAFHAISTDAAPGRHRTATPVVAGPHSTPAPVTSDYPWTSAYRAGTSTSRVNASPLNSSNW